MHLTLISSGADSKFNVDFDKHKKAYVCVYWNKPKGAITKYKPQIATKKAYLYVGYDAYRVCNPHKAWSKYTLTIKEVKNIGNYKVIRLEKQGLYGENQLFVIEKDGKEIAQVNDNIGIKHVNIKGDKIYLNRHCYSLKTLDGCTNVMPPRYKLSLHHL